MGPGPVDIGVLGTGTLAQTSGKLDRMASVIAGLGRPVLLVDTRRTGQGGRGSWGPLEFATLLPEKLGGANGRYSYLHMPCVAPLHEQLVKAREAANLPALNPHSLERSVHALHTGHVPPPAAWANWKVFSTAYKQSLTATAVLAARAVVEGAQARGGLAIFLGAEPHLSGFDRCPPQLQDEHYCHRYTLATAVGRAIKQEYRWADIRCLHLALDDSPSLARY